jgi:hypothetical protein
MEFTAAFDIALNYDHLAIWPLFNYVSVSFIQFSFSAVEYKIDSAW